MFTGIIEEVGQIVSVQRGQVSSRLKVKGAKIFEDIHLGDSIAVNGVCLTATAIDGDTFEADVMAETLRRTNLGTFRPGSRVNLERAMSAGGRFGGHIVSGHIDGTGSISSMVREENAVWVKIITGEKLLKYIIEKGSITIDGISLTVAELGEDYFKVSVIPHTGSETTLLTKKPGDVVNLENDVIGKYVERLLNFGEGTAYTSKSGGNNKKSSLSMDMLAENGFL
jgi:riboflavin synthase